MRPRLNRLLSREHAGLAHERQIAGHRATLRRYQGMYDYFVVHHPRELELTWYCCSDVRWETDMAAPESGVLRGRYCNERPWCIRCNDRETRRRVAAALSAAQRVVPKGQKPWIRRFVVTAPTGDDDWGWRAVKDPGRMFAYAKDFLEWVFGKGIGGIFSLHWMGEEGPVKPHPHIDGFLVDQTFLDGEVRRLRSVSFDKAWQEERDEAMIRAAQRAYGGLITRPGDFWLGHAKQGIRVIRPEIMYQMRELMDPRKIRYGPQAPGRVGWRSYKGRGFLKVRWSTVDAFEAGVAKMGQVLRPWGGAGRGSQWHRGVGFMAKSAIQRTQDAVGGEERVHWRGCVCVVCRDFLPEEMLDVEMAVAQARVGLDWRLTRRV